jgi:hypothetical protein
MWRAVLVVVVVAVGATARARADVRLRAVPAVGDAAPTIRATVIGNDAPAPGAVTLVETDVSPPIEMRATRIAPYREDGEPIAIAVVVEGHNLWMTDPIIAKIGDALDAVATAGPPGSLGELVVYGNGARVISPMRDLRRLDRRALGDASAYQGIVTRDLASGVERATMDLRAARAPRKALIVIGDGADTDPSVAATALAKLRATLAGEGVEVDAIFYEAADDDFEGDLPLLRTLAPDASTALGAVEIVAETRVIVGDLDRRFDAVFPGEAFTWDGANHTFAMQIGAQRVDGLALELCCIDAFAAAPRRWPWLVLAGGVALFAFAIAIAVRRRRERAFATR